MLIVETIMHMEVLFEENLERKFKNCFYRLLTITLTFETNKSKLEGRAQLKSKDINGRDSQNYTWFSIFGCGENSPQVESQIVFIYAKDNF